MVAKRKPKRRKLHAESHAESKRRISSQMILSGAVLLVILLAVGITMYLSTMVYYVRTMPFTFVVQERLVGLHTGDELHLGGMPPGGTGTRQIVLTTEKDAIFSISAMGEGSEWIDISQNGFLLKAGDNATVDFRVHPPKNATEKTYNGTVRIVAYRPGLLGGRT